MNTLAYFNLNILRRETTALIRASNTESFWARWWWDWVWTIVEFNVDWDFYHHLESIPTLWLNDESINNKPKPNFSFVTGKLLSWLLQCLHLDSNNVGNICLERENKSKRLICQIEYFLSCFNKFWMSKTQSGEVHWQNVMNFEFVRKLHTINPLSSESSAPCVLQSLHILIYTIHLLSHLVMVSVRDMQ